MVKIFVVEDDKDIMRLFDELLALKGHEVIARASNGEEAVEVFKTLNIRPDLILMDHRMPKKDGLEAMKEILVIDPNSKIIFISADRSAKEKAFKEGAIHFLEKPIDFKMFSQILMQL